MTDDGDCRTLGGVNFMVETLDKRVDRELAKLPRDLFAQFLWIANLLTEQGPKEQSGCRMCGPCPVLAPVYTGIVDPRLTGIILCIHPVQASVKQVATPSGIFGPMARFPSVCQRKYPQMPINQRTIAHNSTGCELWDSKN